MTTSQSEQLIPPDCPRCGGHDSLFITRTQHIDFSSDGEYRLADFASIDMDSSYDLACCDCTWSAGYIWEDRTDEAAVRTALEIIAEASGGGATATVEAQARARTRRSRRDCCCVAGGPRAERPVP